LTRSTRGSLPIALRSPDPLNKYDPDSVGSDKATYLAALVFGLEFDKENATIHEFGHALSLVEGRNEMFNIWSVETENQLRARLGEHRFRTREKPIDIVLPQQH
jgi:hypothetical protein